MIIVGVYRLRFFPVLINTVLCVCLSNGLLPFNTANLNQIVSLIRALMLAFIPIIFL